MRIVHSSKVLFPSLLLSLSIPAVADQVFLDDLIVDGSACIGMDCANGENFGFDTLRLKENNLRIKFDDTSGTGSFPNNDWQITINESDNGGANKFSIDDVTNGKTPFTIEANTPSHTLYVSDDGRVGVGTSNPVVGIHSVDGNSPTLRLEQDGSSGFTPQIWDLAGNETNFFIRDVTNSSDLTFRIYPGTGEDSLVLRNGRAGFGDNNPQTDLHVKSSTDTPTLRLQGSSNASQKWDIVGGDTSFIINDETEGTNPVIINKAADTNSLVIADDGAIAMGKATPAARLDIETSVNGTTTSGVAVKNTKADHGVVDAVVLAELTSTSGSPVIEMKTEVGTTPPVWHVGMLANSFIIRDTLDTDYEFILQQSGSITITGTLTEGSSRQFKENFSDIDVDHILEKVTTLDIQRWNYKKDGAEVQHIGPIAEDFYEAFGGLGEDESHISTIDRDGVALAAIQALHKNQQLKDEATKKALAQKDAEIAFLKHQLSTLTKAVEKLAGEPLDKGESVVLSTH